MFLGHYGVAFGLKRADPKLSLASLFLAAQFVDLLWGIFLILGWERVRVDQFAANPSLALIFEQYPISHSLLGGFCWAVIFGAVAYSLPTRDRSRHHAMAALLLAVAVASHWFLDLIMHRPDLPLAGMESTMVGLGLWNSVAATIAVELAVLFAGVLLYLTAPSRRIQPRPGRLAVLLGVMLAAYAASFLSTPPSNATVLGIGAIVLIVVLTALAGWADRVGA
ncbi:MAG: hypothetical protein ACREL6_01655 [Gemmatimonadales bacterium]